MAWELVAEKEMTPNIVYDILKKHRLLPESVVASASICNAVGTSGQRFTIREEDGGETVAEVFVSDVEINETASLDIVPVARFFRTGFHEELKSVMKPILDDLFIEFKIRRIGSAIPASRSRTKKALCVLGFRVEGRLKDAIKLHGEEPQDLRMLGMTRSDYEGIK